MVVGDDCSVFKVMVPGTVQFDPFCTGCPKVSVHGAETDCFCATFQPGGCRAGAPKFRSITWSISTFPILVNAAPKGRGIASTPGSNSSNSPWKSCALLSSWAVSGGTGFPGSVSHSVSV